MIDRWRTVDPQTALIQVEGELHLKPRPHRKNVTTRPTQSKSQSSGEDTQPLSRRPMREARRASGNPKIIQSP
jgi:hypothetical protein